MAKTCKKMLKTETTTNSSASERYQPMYLIQMYVLDSIREQSMYCVGAICPLCAIRGEPNHAPVLPLKNPSAYTLLSFRIFSPKQLFILSLLGWSWISVRADTGASRWPSFWELRKLCAKLLGQNTWRNQLSKMVTVDPIFQLAHGAKVH